MGRNLWAEIEGSVQMSTVRVWLNKAAVQKLGKDTEGRGDFLNGLFLAKEDGMSYILLSGDVTLAGTQIPEIPRKYIKCVTYQGSHQDGIQPSGVYVFKGARATVTTSERYKGHAHIVTERVQFISISAKSIRTLREFYGKFRRGALEPTEDWS